MRKRLAAFLDRIRCDDPACVEVELACEGDEKDALTDEQVGQLAAALKTNRHTRSLNVWGNTGITNAGAEALLSLLVDNIEIDRINLELTGVSDSYRARVQRTLFQRCIAAVSDENPDKKHVHMLDLSRRDLSDEDVQLVASCLGSNTSITSLSLWGNPRVTDSGLQHLLKVLQTKETLVSMSLEGTAASKDMQRSIAERINRSRCHKALQQAVDPRISVINLANASLTDPDVNELAQALRSNRTLTTLILTGNTMISGACADNLLTALDEVPYLTSLAIDASFINNEKVSKRIRQWKIGRLMHAMLINAEACTKVDFTSCRLVDQEWPQVLDALRSNSTVVSLNLGASKLSEASVKKLLQIIPTHASLSRINTSHLHVKDGEAKTLSTDGSRIAYNGGDVSTDLRNLVSLALRERILARAGQALENNSVVHLEELQHIDVTDKELATLASAVAQCTSLTALTLKCGANLSRGGVVHLLGDERQRYFNTHLTRLNLVNTPQSVLSLQDRKGLRKLIIGRAMSQALNVVHTDLSHCKIDLSDQELQDDEALQVCSAISKRPHHATVELDLSNNPLTNRSALSLLEMLAGNVCVLKIDLRGTYSKGTVRQKIGDKLRVRATGHASRLLSSVFHPPLLRRSISIDFLQGQELSDSDVTSLADRMCKGNMVEAIDLSCNPGITDASGSKLLQAIKFRHHIHTLNLHGTGVSAEIMGMIQQQLDLNAFNCCVAELESNASQRDSILYLKNRGLADNDVSKIAQSLVLNKTISRMDFSGNAEITDASIRAFEAAVTNNDYHGIARLFIFSGTRTSAETVARLSALLRSAGASRIGYKKGLSASEESAHANSASKHSHGISGKRDSQWARITCEVDSVKRMISDMVAALELEKDGVTSSALLNIPVLPSFTLDPSRYRTLQRDIKGVSSDEVTAQAKAKMRVKAVGVRLKFTGKGVQLTRDGLASSLRLPLHCIRLYPDRYDTYIFDIRLFDVSLNPDAGEGSASETCDDVAARLFSVCQDSQSSFCRQYNCGNEVFCHYPWALTDAEEADVVPESTSGLSLESCIPHVMQMGSTEWESKLQTVFSGACHQLNQALLDQVFNSASIRQVCQQFAAKALIELEKAAKHSLSLQRYVSPDEAHARFSLEHGQRKGLCEEFMSFVRWITGGGQGMLPIADPEVEAALLMQWSHVKKFFGNLKQDEASLKGLKSASDPTFVSFLESKTKEAHETAQMMDTRCQESLVKVQADLTDLAVEKERRVGDINDALAQIRVKRNTIAQQLEKTFTRRNHDMIEIQRYLKSYTEHSKRILALSKQDDALAGAERTIENDAAVADLNTQLNGLHATQKDWKRGIYVASTLRVSIVGMSKEMRDLIEFEHQRLDHGIRDLSLQLFKNSFYPVYMMSLLETERLKYSIAIDRTEADRTLTWSDIYHPVGKLRKPRIAYQTWTNSAATVEQQFVDPSPFQPGSSAQTQHSWGSSYDRQRKSTAVVSRLVLDMPFHTISMYENGMEAFRDKLRVDVATALDCNTECIEVLSVVSGSVVATIGLLSDLHATHGERSPLDLLAELIRQAVDSSSPLRAGKYTCLIKEVNHVPNSMADQSLHDQELRVASIRDVCDRIENESGSLWAGMTMAKTAVNICPGTDTELLIFRVGDYAKDNLFNGDTHLCIPHYRLIKPAISYEEFIDQGTSDWGQNVFDDYLKSTEKRMRAACAASKKFAVEYKDAAMHSKRTQENVMRLRGIESKFSASLQQAVRQLELRDSKVKDQTTLVTDIEQGIARAEYIVKLAADDFVVAEKVLAQRRVDWQRNEDEVFDVKCLECSTMTQMVVPYAEARIAKTKHLFCIATQGLYLARWKRAAGQLVLERAQVRLAPITQLRVELERAQALAQNEKELAEHNLHEISASLVEAKTSAVERKHVLHAYQWVANSAPPVEEVDKSKDWLIPHSQLIYRTIVCLTVGAPYSQVVCNVHSKSKFETAVSDGLIQLLLRTDQSKKLKEDVEKRVRILETLETLTGQTLVHVALVRDHPDINIRFDEMLFHLQQELMPTKAGAVPVQLHTGVGATGSSIVHKLEIRDPLGWGQFGEVREGDYNGVQVVAKTIHFQGAHAHVARVRTDHLAGELASQVSTLCLASHPNILRVHGVCFEEREDGPPFCALVHDYANDNLFNFIAKHNAPHAENVHLSCLDLNTIFEALDPHQTGRVTQAAFVNGIAKHPRIAQQLQVPDKVRAKQTLHYVWNYGTHKGSILDPPSEYHHQFAWLDRKGAGSFDVDDLILYYGPRELPEGRIAWPHRIAVVLAVAQGMHYLIEHGLVHGNLKTGNVALADANGGVASGTWMLKRIAIMDFGMPHLRKGFALMPSFQMSTPAWLAPERLIDPARVTQQGDIWSFGVIMWEILTGEVPWPGKTVQDLCILAHAGTLQLPILRKHHDLAPAGYISIMRRCMDPVPARRPTFHAVLEMVQESKSQWRSEYLPG